MATKPKAVAAKAPAKKTAAAPAPAKKTAAKPAPVPVVEETETEFAVGQVVRALAYGDDVLEEDRVLTEGEQYEITAIEDGMIFVSAENPNFNPKKKEDPETNPKMVEAQVMPDEIELVEDGDEEAEDEAEEDEAEEEAEEAEEEEVEEEAEEVKPAKKAAAKTAPAKKTAPAAKEDAKPAKGKAKAEAPAPKGKKKAAEPVVEEAAEEEVTELENEDPEIVALLDAARDAEGGLVAYAQSLEADAARTEFQLGAALYHIKKDKAYLEIEGGEAYAEKGGFEKFVQEIFFIEYRKAMYLIDIYVTFTEMGIENAAERVAIIGWTKAAKLCKPLREEGAVIDDLLELAETNSVSDLSTALKEQVEVGGTKGEKKTRLTVKFRYFEDDAATVESILGTAQEQFGVKELGEALLQILTEWAQNNAGTEVAEEEAPKTKAPAKKTAPKKTVKA